MGVLCTWDTAKEWMYDMSIVVRKNLTIRRRRYIATIVELLTPIMITIILATFNAEKSLFRSEPLQSYNFINNTEEKYALGDELSIEKIHKFRLCNRPDDIYPCIIGYVADDSTHDNVFTIDSFTDNFNMNFTKFERFQDESTLEECIADPEACPQFQFDSDNLNNFRGAVVFESNIYDLEVIYKIRLLERYYDSLKHVYKTHRLSPSVYDRSEYVNAYIFSGFLDLQLQIDLQILRNTQIITNDPYVDLGNSSNCTCRMKLRENPHRRTDHFHRVEWLKDAREEDYDYTDELSFDIEGFVTRSLIISTIIVMSFAFLIPAEQRRIVTEKETGLTILLLVTGMTHRMQWLGNLISTGCVYAVAVTFNVIILMIPFNRTEGAVFEMLSPIVLWLLYFLYILALTSCCYFCTVFFERPVLAITVSITIWMVTFVAPVYHLDMFYDEMHLLFKLLLCFHPSIAFRIGLKFLLNFERDGEKTFTWTLAKDIPFDEMRLIYIYIMLILDIILYMMLAIYLDRVFETKLGVPKPWYYPFLAREWGSNTNSNKISPSNRMVRAPTSAEPGLESYPNDVEPSVVMIDLTKKYGKVVAADKLNIKLLHGEIFALLGHNGAGKSSTLGLLSGYVPPTSGTAYVRGFDIKTHMTQIQSFTGMCPQSNTLYDDLTTREHLLIFGRLRGLRGDAEEECSELLDKLHLSEMKNLLTRKLSKGDKRKLCLAIALIGNPQLIVLDEPTGGMDYYSRRAVWDVLLKIRSDHTIIFSTHFMDEAELLGDRIGILSNGKMIVSGSHAFLRRHVGFGYSLKMSVDPEQNPDAQKILEIVRRSLPNATLSTLPMSPTMNRVCCVNLPMEGYSSKAMSALFTDLSKLRESLGVVGFSLSYATVDEIFLALTFRMNPSEEITIEEESSQEPEKKPPAKVKAGCTRPCVQFFTLLKKKIVFTLRKKTLVFFQIFIPIAIFVFSFLRLSWSIHEDGRSGPSLKITMDAYRSPITLFTTSTPEFPASLLQTVIGPSARPGRNADVSNDMTKIQYRNLQTKYVLGIAIGLRTIAEYIVVYFSPYYLHSSPLAINMYSNILTKKMDINRKITLFNHPLQHPYFTGSEFYEDPQAAELFAVSFTLGLSILAACFLVMPLEERLNEVKHLQLMSGASSLVYWLASFVWDIMLVMIVLTTVLLFTALYEPTQIFTRSGRRDHTTKGLLCILLSFSYCGIMLSYLLSHFARTVSGGFSFLIVMTLFSGGILPFFTASAMPSGFIHSRIFLWTMRMIPTYSVASALRKYAKTVVLNSKCNHFTDLGLEFYCADKSGVNDFTCCPNCPEIPESSNCYDPYELLRGPWSTVHRSYNEYLTDTTLNENSQNDEFHFKEYRSAIAEIFCLIGVGMVFNFFVIFLDTDLAKQIEACMFGFRGRAFQTDTEDKDVIDEAERVNNLVENDQIDEDFLIAHNLGKNYGVFPAVQNVSIGIHPGECFGILGVNGAGKSTLFSLLTAATTQTYGNVYSVDCSLSSGRSLLMQKMGYSPHTGSALLSYMTPKEIIYFFSRLRGLTMSAADEETKDLLHKFKLESVANVQCGNLSGGTKRKLSTAVAIIADPPIVLMDEPTSAADPVSRRLYWNTISSVKKTGQTVVFNSHRIHECEALCHRIGILVDGKFQCIGSPSQLKDKFGKGFKLMIKLSPGTSDNKGYVSSLNDTVVATFNPCTLRDRRRNVVQYVIHDFSVSWDFLFSSMEHIKLRYPDLVEDYTFSQTTLEEVFLTFVIMQNCGRVPDTS